MSSRLRTVILHGTAVAILTSAAMLPAYGQVGAFSEYLPSGVDQFGYVLNRIQMQAIFRKAEQPSSEKPPAGSDSPGQAAPPVQAADTVVVLQQGLLGPRKLARSYPKEHRAAAEQTFVQLLQGYGSIESRFGIPRGDMAGAMAALMAGSLSACRDEDIPDAGFREAVDQLRLAIRRDDRFPRISNAEKQEAYEQFAILGTMLALTRTGLQHTPDAASEQRVRAAGCSYLDQLGIDPRAVALTEKGFVAL